MSFVFADTSYFLALLNPEDRFHSKAVTISGDPGLNIVTTELVVVEVGNFLSKTSTRYLFTYFLAELTSKPRIRVLSTLPDLIRRGCDLYVRRSDKNWSVTDCTSFVVMEDQNLAEALTTDAHFRQAGFNPLLIES